MKIMRMMPILLGAILATAPASAQPGDDHGTVRSVSLMEEIGPTCRRFFEIDEKRAAEFRAGIARLATEFLGSEAAFEEAIARERSRRRQEISDLTPRIWCREKKAYLSKLRTIDIFPP